MCSFNLFRYGDIFECNGYALRNRFNTVGLSAYQAHAYGFSPAAICLRSSRMNQGRVFVKLGDRDGIGCPQFKLISYTFYTFVISPVDLDRIFTLTCYWRLNAALLVCKDYGDRISEIVKWNLMGAIINSQRWATLKKELKIESVAFSKELTIEGNVCSFPTAFCMTVWGRVMGL